MRRLVLTSIAFLSLASPAHAAWVWPVQGEVITPYRNGTDAYASGQHRGIDIAAAGGAPVVAAAAGEVRFAGTAGSSGLTVSIRTGDGYDTSYLHLSSLAVRAGAHVGAGDRVGAVGTSGTRSAVQPHLHFGVRDAGTRHAYRDPMGFLPPPPPHPRGAEPPPPATAPEPAPAPPAAAPAPARLPAAAPRTAPHPAPMGRRARRPAPAGGRAPRPAPAGTRVPASVPRDGPALQPAGRAPALPRLAHPGESAAPGREGPRTTPALGGSRDLDARPGSVAVAPDVSARRIGTDATPSEERGGVRPDTADSRGPDLGWALACAGLLLAAGVLGLTDGGRRRRPRRNSRPVRRPRVASMVHAVLRHNAHLLRQR